jgi:Type II CAAX prenyl endopeptidase Rce1-like
MTMFMLLVMSSVVAGVTEEAGFRGYMQGPIERRYGLAVGILVNGMMFGLLHFPNHPDAVMLMLPYYIAVAAVYGGLTWAANSILPALCFTSRCLVIDTSLANRPAGVGSIADAPWARPRDGCGCVAVRRGGCRGRLGGATFGLCRSLRRLTVGQPALDLDIAARSP